jgi:hypothetical protein
MTPPLGIGLAIGGTAIWGDAAAAIEDKYWKATAGSPGELTPVSVPDGGVIPGIHETWDLDGTDYTLKESSSVKDEGYWEVSSGDVQPVDPTTWGNV